MTVVWGDSALEDWWRLSLKDAKLVAVAVENWAARGEGLVIFVEGEFLLLAGAYAVVLLVDTDRDHVYVDRVRRA